MSKSFDLTELRQNIISKYSQEVNEENLLDVALIEINDTSIFDDTYEELFVKYTPKTQVYMSLTKKFSPATAKAIVHTVSKLLHNPMDLQEENNKSILQIDAQIASLRSVIQKIEVGEEGYIDIDVQSVYAELRQWLTLRTNIIRGISQDILTEKKIKADIDKLKKPSSNAPTGSAGDLSSMSTEELEAMLKGIA